MIFQGLFNVLNLYLNEIYLFYDSIDNYFKKKLYEKFEARLNNDSFDSIMDDIVEYLEEEFMKLGFLKDEMEHYYIFQLSEIKDMENGKIRSLVQFYDKIIPVINEFFLEKIFEYIIDDEAAASTMSTLRSKELLPISFIMELRNLKTLFERNPSKVENLRKYIKLRDKIIGKLLNNKKKIERVNDSKYPRDKLQLFYMLYRIIAFFNLQQFFDFTEIRDFIENNMDDWLDTIPLVSLKNPDLYYCGIYLAEELSIPIDETTVKYFLLNVYDENIDEFEAPLVEATNQVYFFLESAWLVDLELSEIQIKELLKGDKKYYESNYLKNLETSQLVLILKIYKILGVYNSTDPRIIKSIIREIDQRITSDGIIQYRDGFISSEATYHVILSYYMREDVKKLKKYDFIDRIISRIYRNLEILVISEETNYDLVSEIFYSCETLRLLNCIEMKNVLVHLVNHLFPSEVCNKLNECKELAEITEFNDYCRHVKVNKITGEKILK
ncbi:MAG: hypothetical protein BAJALOKI2v1_20052 [Promethearchaeota archaeon]|nr:MAG: hypothetical protein BAJALOKI2v1_20052 [Candidatus Lokiarchaeota archaeon]